MNESIKLVLKEGTTFDLYFYDGKVKRYDALWLADKFPQLNKLKDRKIFEQAKLFGWSGVMWNRELDIDCDTVYDEGIDVSNEYDDIENVVLGYSIKKRRLDLELSQKQLADKIGIDQSDLSKIEKGLFNPTVRMIERIAKGLDSKLKISIE